MLRNVYVHSEFQILLPTLSRSCRAISERCVKSGHLLRQSCREISCQSSLQCLGYAR